MPGLVGANEASAADEREEIEEKLLKETELQEGKRFSQ
jgi:hypothetical protein